MFWYSVCERERGLWLIVCHGSCYAGRIRLPISNAVVRELFGRFPIRDVVDFRSCGATCKRNKAFCKRRKGVCLRRKGYCLTRKRACLRYKGLCKRCKGFYIASMTQCLTFNCADKSVFGVFLAVNDDISRFPDGLLNRKHSINGQVSF